ncbi:MAG: glycosyltransferase family 4 protein [Syntrophales bacterium]|nr:glycosyltransferase family 4 protein [Syntrophales bacterium]
MEGIRVVHVITRIDKGGSAENTLLTAGGLRGMNYDVSVIKGPSHESNMTLLEREAAGKSLSALEAAGVSILTDPDLVRSISPVQDVRSLLRMTSLFQRIRPQIVHTHTSKAGVLGRFAAALARVPIVVHTPHGHVFHGYFAGPETKFFVILERLAARLTDRIIMLTDGERKDHLRFRVGPEEKFITIHSGVGLAPFTPGRIDSVSARKDLGIPPSCPVVGAVGRLTRIKGHRYLLEAANLVLKEKPETRFVILGSGELEDDLKELALALGIENNVIFPGWRPDVAAVLAAFDVFAFPSLNEGMGKAVVEAMSMGLPVVASRIGGIPDLVEEGLNGVLVPAADPRALATSILDMLGDPEKRNCMGQRGKTKASSFGTDSMIEKVDRLYRDLLIAKGIA